MALKTLFTTHPASVDETYGEHLVMASGFGWKMLLGAFACFAHAALPFCFEKTGSSIIDGLHDRMVVNRRRSGRASALQVKANRSRPSPCPSRL
jgi:hypothetical protein